MLDDGKPTTFHNEVLQESVKLRQESQMMRRIIRKRIEELREVRLLVKQTRLERQRQRQK